jgi:demethylmenaquinone methyltransferase / 2-methoxy-6-polyprenyl-1,4-benzoquinol methylase
MPMSEPRRVDFGFESVAEGEKAKRVAGVFDSVADRYDLMNDLMSGGLHRLWKRFTVAQSGVRAGHKVLDIAGGTGDLAQAFLDRVGSEGRVLLTDINGAMLARGRDRLLDAGRVLEAVRCDAERLPFPDRTFDCVSVAFGLRNMTHKEQALAEMFRVLRPGGRLLVLEFSHVWQPLEPLYRLYTMQLLPAMGRLVANDSASYRYLAESIARHPDQETLKSMLEAAGFERVEYFNLNAGVVALHRGFRL